MVLLSFLWFFYNFIISLANLFRCTFNIGTKILHFYKPLKKGILSSIKNFIYSFTLCNSFRFFNWFTDIALDGETLHLHMPYWKAPS